MNKRQLAKFKSFVERAIKKNIKNGGKLIFGDFELESRIVSPGETYMCPIEIVTHNVKIPGKRTPSYESRLSVALGFEVRSTEMWSFIYGYDGTSQRDAVREIGLIDKNLFLLGKNFRKLYKPLSAKKYV